MRWRNPFTGERVHPIDLMVLAVACLLAAIGSLKGALGLARGISSSTSSVPPRGGVKGAGDSPMEGFFAAVGYLAQHPDVAATIEVATLALILVGMPSSCGSPCRSPGRSRQLRAKRAKAAGSFTTGYETADELGKKIEKITEDQREHERRDEQELAKIDRGLTKIGTAVQFIVTKNGGPDLDLGDGR